MMWQEGDKVVCEVAFDFANPVLVGRKFQMRPGRTAQIVEVLANSYKVGWFDFGTGHRDGFVEHTVEGLEHHWRRYEIKTPIAPRNPRPMVISYAPEDPHKRRTKLHIGYWANSKDPKLDSYEKRGILLAWPEDYVDPDWKGHERNLVIAHLRNAPDSNHYFGFATCRLCGIKVGSSEKSDGTYVWPAGLAHYLEDHSLRPPPEFLSHVIRYNAKKS